MVPKNRIFDAGKRIISSHSIVIDFCRAFASRVGVRRLRVFIATLFSLLLISGCATQLEKFLAEDKDIVITYGGDNASTLNIDASGGYITVQFSADRFVNYSIRYGADCTSGSLASILPQSGAAEAGQSVSARMNYSELMANGGSGLICVADKAAYKKASLTKTFSTTTITNYVTQYNETNGGSGAPQSNGITAAFQLFQDEQTAPGWSNSFINRDGGATKRSGVSFNYGMLVAIDPNDGYKKKFFLADRNNHRILIFHSMPLANSALPDVVVGQNNFTTGGLGTTASSFYEPTDVAVCADGKMFVADSQNNRVAGFNSIPTTNGASMNFVLGQTNFTTGTATAVSASTLSIPYSVACISSRLYIADRGYHRIVVHNTIPTSNSAASFAIGQPDLTTAALGTDYTNVSYLNEPIEILYTGSQFFIADIMNSRVLVYNALPTASGATPTYRIGQSLINGGSINEAGANPTNTTLARPRGLAFRTGKLAIADTENHRLVFYDLPISNNSPTVTPTHQMGQPDFNTGTVPGTTAQSTFNNPRDLLFDGNYIWVQDRGNNRLQILALPF